MTERPVGRVASGFEISQQRLADLITLGGSFRLGRRYGRDGARPDDLQQCSSDGVIDTQAAEGDAARLAVFG